MAFGLRGQRLDDVLAFEHMNISHRAVPSNYGTRSLSAKPQSNAALSFPAGTGTDARFDYSMIERRSGTGPKARLIGNAQHQRILIQRLGSYILPFRPLDRITEFAHTDLLEVIRIIEARKVRAAVFQKGFYLNIPGKTRPIPCATTEKLSVALTDNTRQSTSHSIENIASSYLRGDIR